MKMRALSLLMFLLAVLTAGAQNARVQIIHNSPEGVVDLLAPTY
jgi:Skp family chaperone for outer membrane proteins